MANLQMIYGLPPVQVLPIKKKETIAGPWPTRIPDGN